jgi:glycosyltransferase involved in cell wall biosynthesis
MQALVSVLMTSYNREAYIGEAIQSVLASDYTNFELIVVDDGSTDNTVKIARTYEIMDDRVKVYVNVKNLGQFPNRNKAASYARGTYLKYFDSDDIMFPHCLRVMVGAMEKYPDAGAGAITIREHSKSLKLPHKYSSKESLLRHYFTGFPLLYIGPSGTIFRRDVFFECGGFNQEIGILSDTLLMLSIASKHSIASFESDLFHWRIHDQQVTIGQQDWYEMQKQRFEINSIVLNSKDIPLSAKELSIIKRNIKNIFIRNIVKRLVAKRTIAECTKLMKFGKIRFTDVMLAALPNKKQKV